MSMKSINKIRERDLDDALLAKLLKQGVAVDVDNIFSKYMKKTDVLSESNIPESYTESFNNKIAGIQKSLDDLKNSQSDGQNTEISRQINSISNQIAILKDTVAKLTLPDGTFVSDAIKQNSESIKHHTDQIALIQDSLSKLSELSGSYSDISDRINTLTARLNDVSTKISELDSSIKNDIENTYRKLNVAITAQDLDPDLQNTIKQASDLIAKFANTSTSSGQSLYGTEGELAVFGADGTAKSTEIFHNDSVICHTESELQTALSDHDSSDDIVDLANKKVYSLNPEYDSNDANSQKYIVTNFSDSLAYRNSFLYDSKNNQVQLIIAGNLTNIKVQVFLRDVTINPSESAVVQRDNVFEKPPVQLLVRDTDANSRANNKYIEANHIAAIVYGDNGYTIYNDDTVSHEFRILGGD